MNVKKKCDAFAMETYLIRVSSVLVFCSVGSVAECFGAAWEFASVGLLSRVRAQMSL